MAKEVKPKIEAPTVEATTTETKIALTPEDVQRALLRSVRENQEGFNDLPDAELPANPQQQHLPAIPEGMGEIGGLLESLLGSQAVNTIKQKLGAETGTDEEREFSNYAKLLHATLYYAQNAHKANVGINAEIICHNANEFWGKFQEICYTASGN